MALNVRHIWSTLARRFAQRQGLTDEVEQVQQSCGKVGLGCEVRNLVPCKPGKMKKEEDLYLY